MRRGRKVPARVVLRRLEQKADKALSLLVRELTRREYGGKCPLCGEGKIECCFHFVRRRRKILRWSLRNVIGACHRCNYVEYRLPDLSRAWFVRKFGAEAYLALVDESVKPFVPTAGFLTAIIMACELELARLKGEGDGEDAPAVAPDRPVPS